MVDEPKRLRWFIRLGRYFSRWKVERGWRIDDSLHFFVEAKAGSDAEGSLKVIDKA